MAHELRAISPNRVLTNSTPLFAFSYFLFDSVDQNLNFGNRLSMAPPEPFLNIYSVGLNQFWNGAAYADGRPGVLLNQINPGGQSARLYTYPAPVGLVRGVPDTLILFAYANSLDLSQTLRAVQVVNVEYSLADQPIGDLAFAAGDTVTTVGQLLNILKLTQYNDQEINDLSKELVFYRDALDGNGNQQVGLRFRLKDSSGNMSAREVFRKERQ